MVIEMLKLIGVCTVLYFGLATGVIQFALRLAANALYFVANIRVA